MAAPSAITLPTEARATAATVWNNDPVDAVKVFASDVEATVLAGLAAGQTADGATLVIGDVVLAITPPPHKYSGIYVVGAGSGARHADADAPADFVPNMRVPIVGDGATYKGRTARYAGAANPVIGTSGLPFVFDPQVITPP